MNNIEILEEFIEQYKASYPEEKEWVAIYPNQIEAIENLIQENKELKEENHQQRHQLNSAYIYYGNCKTFTDYQIKSIVTKEQFSQMEYKVKE